MKNIDWGETIGTIIGIGVWVLILGVPIASSLLPKEDSTTSAVSTESGFESDSSYEAEPDYDSIYTDDSSCNSNYSGCIDGSYYVLDCVDIGYEVEVIGYDEYGLDRDGDGYGCETY